MQYLLACIRFLILSNVYLIIISKKALFCNRIYVYLIHFKLLMVGKITPEITGLQVDFSKFNELRYVCLF